MSFRKTVVLTVLAAVCLVAPPTRYAAAATESAPRRPIETAALPMSFEPNVGQTDARVRYVARGRGYAVFLTDEGAVLSLVRAREADALRMSIVGARPTARVAGERELAGKSNYLCGSDPAKWRRDVPNYGAVRLAGVYEGVDAVFYGSQEHLEYDFVVAAGADPGQIRVRFEGHRAATVDENGDLVLALSGGELRHRRAVVFQGDGPSRRNVAARYVMTGDGEIGLDLGDYDRSHPLVVDPVVELAVYIGGAYSRDNAQSVAVDASGAAYVVGTTFSTDFPVTPGALDTTVATNDAFVTKIDPSGGSIVYSTYLGGAAGTFASGVAVDASGAAVVVGDTDTPVGDFPVTPGAYDTTYNGGTDAFVTKIAPDGSSLVFSTLLGGEGEDFASSAAVDASGAVYAAGRTFTDDGETPFPTTAGAYDRTVRDQNGFVVKLDASGASAAYASYVGGDGQIAEVAPGPDGTAVVCGFTSDGTFQTTPGAFDRTFGGFYDGFVVRLSATGSSAVFATFLGGTDFEEPNGLAVDAAGAVYVAGFTSSSNFPTTPGALDSSLGGESDAFAAKLSADGASLVYATFLGGDGGESARDIALDGAGATYVVGAASGNFPTTPGAFDTTPNGASDVFVAKLAANGQSLVYSTLLGGARDDDATCVAVDGAGAAYVAGSTASPDWPLAGGLAEASRDIQDAFVVKLAPAGDALAYSTTLGGIDSTLESSEDVVWGVTVDASGAIYLTGTTTSLNFPTTPGAFDETFELAAFPIGSDAFVAKLSPDGSSLVYATFLGGTGSEHGFAIAVDATGVAFVGGTTTSDDFPATAGAFDTTLSDPDAGGDAFVAKLTPDGASLAYATYLGGAGPDAVQGISVDASGAAFAVGRTASSNFPTTPGAFDTVGGATTDAFVAKVAPSGASLAYSTFIGGGGSERANGVAIDASGTAYVSGLTDSNDFPATPGAFDTTLGGTLAAADAFVARVSATGAALVYATYLGGATSESCNGIAVDGSGAAYVVGSTFSADFPTTPGAFDTTFAGDRDAYVTKLAANGASLVYSTFLGGADADEAYGVSLAPGGGLFLTGLTRSADFPTTPDAHDRSIAAGADAFLTALDAAGGLDYSTYFGGGGDEAGHAVAAGGDGTAVFAGRSSSRDLVTTGFGHLDGLNAFVAKLRPPVAGSEAADTPGVYVASSGAWFLRNSNAPGGADLVFTYGPGGAGLVPLAGDWDGDGDATPGLYDPSTGAFFLRNTNAAGGADLVFTFGAGGLGFVPLAGDWDGDGVDTVGLYAPSSGFFFLRNANTPGGADAFFGFGPSGGGWAPLAGDWNGDGADTVGLYGAATGTFFLKNDNAAGAADLAFTYGPAGSTALVGDWDGDGIDTVAVYLPAGGTWFLRNENSAGGGDVVFSYGPSGATPVVGDWDGL